MYLLGYDIGSSSVKAAIVKVATGKKVAVCQYPKREMDIHSVLPGWAEQEPENWWKALGLATKEVLQQSGVDTSLIQGIGISYQMHGLVLVDNHHQVLRPAIIWCDSRAVEIGNNAFEALGAERCFKGLLNSPGNFTASKLSWVKKNEPDIYKKVYKIMLPGDFIAMKMTGKITTTVPGLSEATLWDFQEDKVADFLLDHYHIDPALIPEVKGTFSDQGKLTKEAGKILGLPQGIPVGYRAGDQPNNALSLNVFEPGEVAATGGTSGVVYGVVDRPLFDDRARINSFAHVNHHGEYPRIGLLLCINGSGIQYNWMRQMLAEDGVAYDDIEKHLADVPVGSSGVVIVPFGNGSERVLKNENIGAHIMNLEFNRHGKPHLYRAALEGIAFSFVYGVEAMKGMGMKISKMKVGNDNLFQSATFSNTIANTLNCTIEMMDATGAVGAAKGAGVGIGTYASIEDAFQNNVTVKTYGPGDNKEVYRIAYQRWKMGLEKILQH